MLKKRRIFKCFVMLMMIVCIIGNTVYGKSKATTGEYIVEESINEVVKLKEYKTTVPGTTASPVTPSHNSTSTPTQNTVALSTVAPVSTTNNGIDGGDIAEGVIDALDGPAGILLLPAKFILLLVGDAIRIILGFFAGEGIDGVTIQKILFNKVPLIDINFFDFDSPDMEESVKSIRQNVATWYIGVRNLAAVLLVIVAIYVGLRMAISTVAEEKAKYKQMLIDWVTSLCLLFILHYIMILIIQLNNTLVKTIGESVTDDKLNDVASQFKAQAWANINFSKGMAEALAFLLLEFMTFLYLISYIKRMITIGFLIIIAPLVTVTYSIDKMGDGKSQALNEWFKEFAYNILIQPFQCITFLALCSTALEMLDSEDLKSAVLAICMLIFLNTSEKIIKHIFNFRASSMADTFANAAVMTAAFKGFSNIGQNIAKGGSSNKQNTAEKLQKSNQKANALPVNKSNNSNIVLSEPVSDEAIAAGATAVAAGAVSDSAESNRTENDNSARQNYDTGSQANENSSNNSEEDKTSKKPSKLLSKLGQIAIGANTVFIGGALGGMAGAATGDFKAALTGAMSSGAIGAGIGKRISNSIDNRQITTRTMSALEEYKKERGEISDDQLFDEGMGLLDGTRDARTDGERELRDALMELYNRQVSETGDEEDGLDDTEDLFREMIRENAGNAGNAGNKKTTSIPQNNTQQPKNNHYTDSSGESEVGSSESQSKPDKGNSQEQRTNIYNSGPDTERIHREADQPAQAEKQKQDGSVNGIEIITEEPLLNEESGTKEVESQEQEKSESKAAEEDKEEKQEKPKDNDNSNDNPKEPMDNQTGKQNDGTP